MDKAPRGNEVKVLVATPHCVLGGAEKGLLGIIKRLINRGADVTLVVTQKQGEFYSAFEETGVEILNLCDLSQPSKIKLLQEPILTSDVVLISNDPLVTKLQAILKRKTKASFRTISILRSTFWYFVDMIYTERDTIDRIITINDKIKDHLNQKGLSNVSIVLNGVDTKYFLRGSKAEAKKKLGIDPDTVVITYVGRISEEKNIGSIIRAYKNIEVEKKQLLIVGNIDPNKIALKDFVQKEIDGDESIYITGFQKDVKPYYDASDLNLLASYDEGMPRTLLEATAMQVKTIGTDVGAIGTLIPEEYLVRLTGDYNQLGPAECFNSEDMKIFESKIALALGDSEELIERSRKLLLSKFDANKNEEEIVDIVLEKKQ